MEVLLKGVWWPPGRCVTSKGGGGRVRGLLPCWVTHCPRGGQVGALAEGNVESPREIDRAASTHGGENCKTDEDLFVKVCESLGRQTVRRGRDVV